LSKNNKNVEVVLPAGGSPPPSTDPKVQKQELKTRIQNLKQQIKESSGTLKAIEKEFNKLNKKPAKKQQELKIVKKGRQNKLNGKK
jgi:molecular chaperone GrpE (heat shock protein)